MKNAFLVFPAIVLTAIFSVAGDAFGHGDTPDLKHSDDGHHMMETLREQHRGHSHGHDFEVMDEMAPAEMQRMMRLMTEVGLVLPPMNAERGRQIFLEKGCVACHSVNGVGGDVGPALDANLMPSPMNAFEFAARMWRGAPAMSAMQQAEFGGVIELDGRELADLVAFAHDEGEQKRLSADQVPKIYRKLIAE